MKEKELKQILREDFNFEKYWKPIFSMLFNKVQYFSNPSNPFEDVDKVKSGKQTGIVKLDDGKSLAIFEVEVDDKIHIDKNRQGLREIAIKHIDQNITHGALVFFYSKNQADYRFSFIAKWSEIDLDTGEFRKGETKPKRYTYLLGDNEACTTAAKRLLVLAGKKDQQEIGIKEVIDAFSVESLTKEFFKTYKEHYERFWQFIAKKENGFRNILLDTSKETIELKEKPIRDFAKKLLGRIVFLHFLQKKGWMGCPTNQTKWENGEKQFMQQLFNDFSDKEHFHSKCLTKLFFNTLNTRRTNDIFNIQGLTGKLNGSRVPYLNGGLFDTDKPVETLKIDFPEKYFAELLDFFEQYNFTIDENSPDDHEVGIDPEMLGHIFENLLEENREKGAFYTPKEVVQYMCKESLIQYLNNTFNDDAKIDSFIRFHLVSKELAQKDNAVLLNELLTEIKVCDPAIGSGAFPIGILQEIFEAKKFIYPYLKTNKEFNPAQVKKDIIQKSIYGVDLEKGAVDIAQLRFWLALVVDEEAPHPLPNLDYKIMQGNSLLESFEGIDLSKISTTKSDIRVIEPERDLFGNITESQMKMTFSKTETTEKIQKLIKKFYSVENAEEKNDMRKGINDLVLQHIEYNIELRESQLNRFINEAGNPNNLNKNARKKYDGFVTDLNKIKQTKNNLIEIQKTDERPYFLWHLFFMDVFEKGGFDVMIGNPPYIQLQKMGKDTDILQAENFDTFRRTGDIYTLFYEKGIKLLKKHGVLSLITSNTWMRTKFGEGLREFFISNSNPLKLLNFEDTKIFPSATVEVNIMLLKNEKWQNGLQAVAIKGDYLPGMSINEYFKNKQIVLSELDKEGWVILDKDDFIIKKLVEKSGKELQYWNVEMNFALKSGYNDAFFIDEETKDKLISLDSNSKEVIKPLLRGRNIRKYSYSFDNIYILYIPWHFPLKDDNIKGASKEAEDAFRIQYPAIYNHLYSFKEKLSERNKAETGIRYEWYALQRASATFAENYEKDKIVWLAITDKPAFAYDNKKHYVTSPSYIMVTDFPKYHLVLLNSKLVEWFLDKVSSSTGQGTNQWTKIFMDKIPIPEIDSKKRNPFEILSDYLVLINTPEAHHLFESISSEIISRYFEDVLNMMVYELYFEEHMKEQEIDVLKFIDFEDISLLGTFEEKRNVIQKEYYKLKEKDNPIRNRILLSSTRSPNIIKRINETTH